MKLRATAGVLVGLLALSACATARPTATPVFVAVYQWRVKPGCEERFVRAWEVETRRFREKWGSYGTRLHRADDGTFVATAFWPSREAWQRAHVTPIDTPEAEAVNEACIIAKEQELRMELVEDLSALPR